MRLQKAWRKSTVNRVLKDSVTKQIAAMRIQRFMREWRQHDRTLAIRMAVGSAQQLRYKYFSVDTSHDACRLSRILGCEERELKTTL